MSPRRTKSFVFARPASHGMRGETGKIFCFTFPFLSHFETPREGEATCTLEEEFPTASILSERGSHCADLEEQCHKDFAVLGQFCAKIITSRL